MPTGDELSRDEEFMRRLKQIVLENISNEQFGVEQLSQEIGMNRSHLYRRIKLLRGQSISYFIREIRMEEALKLLRKDVATVSEIAYRVGFNTPSYFHKCFHDHYGYSPGEVKKMTISPKMDEVSILIPKKKKIVGLLTKKSTIIALIVILILGLVAIKYFFTRSIDDDKIKGIAILPLKPLSKDSDQSYLAIGMHDAIIGELGKIRGLRVISKTSTLPFADGSDNLLPEIARKLGVQVIVEGSVFITGDSIRLQIQLIEVFPKEKHLWSQEYYEKIENVLSIQSDLVQSIASEVNVKLNVNENKTFTNKRTIDSEAYKHYLRGMYYLNKNTNEDFKEGMSHLKKAIESDPADPFAYSGLAMGYALLGHGPSSKGGVLKRAKSAAQQALKLDANMTYAHTALAMVYMYHDWNWEKAKESFDTALKINPNNQHAHAHLSWLYLLEDENELAIEHAKLAFEINPLNPKNQLWLAWIFQLTGDYKVAIHQAQELLKFEPKFTIAHFIIGGSYYDQGNYSRAIEEYEKIGFKNDFILSAIGGAYANLGEKEKALEILDQMRLLNAKGSMNPVNMAYLQVALQEKDSAIVYLNEAFEGKMYPLPWVKCVEEFKTMKKDSAFIRLLQKMNLSL